MCAECSREDKLPALRSIKRAVERLGISSGPTNARLPVQIERQLGVSLRQTHQRFLSQIGRLIIDDLYCYGSRQAESGTPDVATETLSLRESYGAPKSLVAFAMLGTQLILAETDPNVEHDIVTLKQGSFIPLDDSLKDWLQTVIFERLEEPLAQQIDDVFHEIAQILDLQPSTSPVELAQIESAEDDAGVYLPDSVVNYMQRWGHVEIGDIRYFGFSPNDPTRDAWSLSRKAGLPTNRLLIRENGPHRWMLDLSEEFLPGEAEVIIEEAGEIQRTGTCFGWHFAQVIRDATQS